MFRVTEIVIKYLAYSNGIVYCCHVLQLFFEITDLDSINFVIKPATIAWHFIGAQINISFSNFV